MQSSNYIQGNIVMNNQDVHSKIVEYANLHLQSIRRLHITVEVMDKNDNVIETIQGLSTGGNINIEGGSLIRRTGSLSFVLFDSLLPRKQSLLWMTNKLRVYAGIENLATQDNTITHFCLGTFFITEPSISIGNDSRSITIDLQDYMMKWEDFPLENKVVIPAGTPIHIAMSMVLNQNGEFNTSIEWTDLTVPYALEFNEGQSVLDIITNVRDLYMDWEAFYDVSGKFIFRKMKIQKKNGEPTIWNFSDEGDLITNFSETFSYKSVKNKVIVVGQVNSETGLTPRAESSITNEISPFHENEIGVRKMVVSEGSYSLPEQCQSRARFELFKNSNMQEKLSIDSLPIYYLDANNVIDVTNHATKEFEEYIIDSISLGLGVSDTMQISCHKMYYDTAFDEGDASEKYKEAIELVIDGIENKGWLSLGEKRIKDFYGLEGNKSKIVVRFEHQSVGGTTAYVTGYLGFDSIQTLTIDLADFGTGVGESGDNELGKGDHNDRILGHEMVHAVMNNSFGMDKTMYMQEWFKEGSGEFIHGADERLKLIIVEGGKISDTRLNGLITRATKLLNGGQWESLSDDYGAGYIIMKYLDKKLSSGKTMKDIMKHIKDSDKKGYKANELIKDAIVAHTPFGTFTDFINNFSANAVNYVKTGISLNLAGDELDTGSIGGSDHRGTIPLNAEDIFKNSEANDITSYGFSVEFDRP
ncbi:DUF5048 domain-containing protein [Bacillus mycoides]|uniref:DUF5048 domain-containing protein n=1 Tax=Bacillus mycoides TaxID=1405 RepID=UPI003D05DA6A